MPARPELLRVVSLDAIPRTPTATIDLAPPYVLDLIPKAERKSHKFIRGASLGAAVYNLIEHDYLNTARDPNSPHMHFADGPTAYQYADIVARSIARGEGFNDIQFPRAMRQELGRIAGYSILSQSPGIIFALHPDYNDLLLEPSTKGAGEGVVYDGAVTLDMIDEHSREALKAIYGNLI